jgi:HK97 family phage portal protein
MSMMAKAMNAIGLGRKSADYSTSAYQSPPQFEYAGEQVTQQSSMALSSVWACANLVSGTISSLPFEVTRKSGDGPSTRDPAHPLQGVIYEAPNSEQTALDFWDFMCMSLELWGNAYARVERLGGRVVALDPIAPDTMAVKRLSTKDLEYRWSKYGERYVVGPEDILHIRGPGGDPVGGMSTLQFGRQAFSAALAADRTAAGMFRNGLRPSAVIKFKEWLTAEQREIAEQRLVQKYMGAMNAGRPMVAEGGSEYQQLSISPEDAQMLETRQFSIEEICRYFGVPPVMIGHAGASTAWPTSVEQQMLVFQTFTLRRRVKRIEQAVSKQLISASDRASGVSVRFNMDALLRGDSVSRASFYSTMTQIGAMTVNEVRAREGMPGVVGGDVARVQMQNVPIGQEGGGNASV